MVVSAKIKIDYITDCFVKVQFYIYIYIYIYHSFIKANKRSYITMESYTSLNGHIDDTVGYLVGQSCRYDLI